MEYVMPELSYGEHYFQASIDQIEKVAKVLQLEFFRKWVQWKGTQSWDIYSGINLWNTCKNVLDPHRRNVIVNGHISKWSAHEIMELLPALAQMCMKNALHPSCNVTFPCYYVRLFEHVKQVILSKTKPSTLSMTSSHYAKFVESLKQMLTLLQLNDDGNNVMDIQQVIDKIVPLNELTETITTFNNIMSQCNQSRSENCNKTIRRCQLLTENPRTPNHIKNMILKLEFQRMNLKKNPNSYGVKRHSKRILALDNSWCAAHQWLCSHYATKLEEKVYKCLHHHHHVHNSSRFVVYLFKYLNKMSDPNLQRARVILRDHLSNHTKNIDWTAMIECFQASIESDKVGLFEAYAMFGKSFSIILREISTGRSHLQQLADIDAKILVQRHLEFLFALANSSAIEYIYNARDTELNAHIQGTILFFTGFLYERGIFVDRNYDLARKYFQMSCLKYNNGLAAHHLGSLFYDKVFGDTLFYIARIFFQQSVPVLPESAFAQIQILIANLEHEKASNLIHSLLIETEESDIQKCLKFLYFKIELFPICTELRSYLFSLKATVEQGEAAFQLSTKGLYLLERVKRMELIGLKHDVEKMTQVFQYFKLISDSDTYILGKDDKFPIQYNSLFGRSYLISPSRIFAINTFRNNGKFSIKNVSEDSLTYRQFDLKKIKFSNYAFPVSEDAVSFSRTYAALRVCEDVLILEDSYHILVEDQEGIVSHVRIENGKPVLRESDDQILKFGAVVALWISPSADLLSTKKWKLSYDDPNLYKINYVESYLNVSKSSQYYLVLLEKSSPCCRFCLDVLSTINNQVAVDCQCGHQYCSRRCLEKDRKLMNHGKSEERVVV